MPNRSSIAKCPGASHLRSADFQSAVSRISNPLVLGGPEALPTGRRRAEAARWRAAKAESRRHRTLETCATSTWLFALTAVAFLIAETYAHGATGEIPAAKFTDITHQAGISFVHVNGAYGQKLLPEAMGGGVAFLDYDNDGAQDLLLVNSCYWPGHIPEGQRQPTPSLYHNDGHGSFIDVTKGSGLEVTCYGMGVAIGDYDNDGLDDIFITAVGGNHLFHNIGRGKFQEVTLEAGVGGSTNDWSTGATFIDYDNDGKLDLFVCN